MDDPHWGWICDGCNAAAPDVYASDGCYLCDDCYERQEQEYERPRKMDEMMMKMKQFRYQEHEWNTRPMMRYAPDAPVGDG